MFYKDIIKKITRYHQRLKGSTLEYDLTPYKNILYKINHKSAQLKNKSDEQLKNLSQNLRNKSKNIDDYDSFLVEAFALVNEAIQRVLNLQPFDTQIIGGMVMNQGKLAEMQTGEGKTLTAVFPVYLNALSGKGVHVLTFNDYLARRDAQWMGAVYKFLGLSVGCVQEGMSIQKRQKAYNADITYLTAKEAGFDYLRDSLCYEKENIVHRPFNYAIVDEADSILIDEARIPLVIAGADDDFITDTYFMSEIAQKLEQKKDFEFDEYARNIHLTDSGQKRVEQLLGCDNLYSTENYNNLLLLNCALHAEYLLHSDVDYIVRNGKIELVDEFTGRVADKRRWPDGLQAAIEAKEKIDVQSKGKILNSITLQHFIQLYPKICGMTATASASEEEFRLYYNLEIVVIPPNKTCIRDDKEDVIYRTKSEKKQAIINEIVKVHKKDRPILVGTQSVEESCLLADSLKNHNVECEILNAKHDEYEAQIIAQAGKLGAVTISTNMAGRGTDIRLGGSDEKEKQKVMKLGGLYVIGTNKHESKRIDQQLRGRAGRQGDPGSSRYFISMEDDIFIKYRLSELLSDKAWLDKQHGEIKNPYIKTEVTRVQRICEGQNLDIKITLCKYSALLEQQRTIFFNRRKNIFFNNSGIDFFSSKSPENFHKYRSLIGIKRLNKICKKITLFYMDKFWSQFLADIAEIREGIHLKRVGGQDPYIEFQKISIKLFDELLVQLDNQLLEIFDSLKIDVNGDNLDELGIKAPSATWTYLINDNPFEHIFGMQLIGNTTLQIGATIMTPFLALHLLFRKRKQNRNN